MATDMVLAGSDDRGSMGQWTRDLDLAALVGMPQPRDIRPVIRKAIEDQAIFPDIIGAGSARANETPQFREETEMAVSGKGREQEVTAFSLNRGGCFVILRRMRRPEAEEAIDRAFIALERAHDAIVQANDAGLAGEVARLHSRFDALEARLAEGLVAPSHRDLWHLCTERGKEIQALYAEREQLYARLPRQVPPDAEPDTRQVIQFSEATMREATEASIAIARADPRLFFDGKSLVQKHERDPEYDRPGPPWYSKVKKHHMVYLLSVVARFERWDHRDNSYRKVNPPDRIASAVISGAPSWARYLDRSTPA